MRPACRRAARSGRLPPASGGASLSGTCRLRNCSPASALTRQQRRWDGLGSALGAGCRRALAAGGGWTLDANCAAQAVSGRPACCGLPGRASRRKHKLTELPVIPAAQLGKKERTLQEVTSPLALQRGHSSGDLPLLPSASASDGCMTPRSRGEEARAGQQLGGAGSHGRGAWQPQPSNLGRSSSGKGGDAAAAGADGAGQRHAVPRLALPARQ